MDKNNTFVNDKIHPLIKEWFSTLDYKNVRFVEDEETMIFCYESDNLKSPCLFYLIDEQFGLTWEVFKIDKKDFFKRNIDLLIFDYFGGKKVVKPTDKFLDCSVFPKDLLELELWKTTKQ